MLVIFLQIGAHVFIDHPQNCAQTSFRSCAGLRPNFGHSRARLCPISFAPCPFPNLAGTLSVMYTSTISAAQTSLLRVTRGGTIHRCIDISRYFSRDTYRDIISYNRDFIFLFFLYNDFHLGRKDMISTCDFFKVIPQN